MRPTKNMSKSGMKDGVLATKKTKNIAKTTLLEPIYYDSYDKAVHMAVLNQIEYDRSIRDL